MKKYYVSLKENLDEEKKQYKEILKQADWKTIKESAEYFLTEAYSHLLKPPENDYEIFASPEYHVRYIQFHVNLAIGLELLLKAILLKKNCKINTTVNTGDLDAERTIPFSKIIRRDLDKIFPELSQNTIQEISNTLELINLRRNNTAHCAKRSNYSYLDEYRFSYITLYIYEKFFFSENPELVTLIIMSLNRSAVTSEAGYKPLRIKPKSLIKH